MENSQWKTAKPMENSDKERNKERFLDSLASKFEGDKKPECLILKSPSDIGVRRNKGRNGARFAPLAIENVFKKMTDHLAIGSFHSHNVSNQEAEKKDYVRAIENSSARIRKFLNSASVPTIHLGGGHDHAFPLMSALAKESKNILIINFDAHCDTRVDKIPHSGTPFRDFDAASNCPFHLAQVGIHDYANSAKTLQPLKRNTMDIIFSETSKEIPKGEKFVDRIFSRCPFPIDQDTALFISLDCDALSSSVMSAVSAVNHNGLPSESLYAWIETLKLFPCSRKVFGIYEYNPLYDDLSQKGARLLAGFAYQFLR
ncbi:MAG: arginase family protein [Bacteriovoracaceae bacterium]